MVEYQIPKTFVTNIRKADLACYRLQRPPPPPSLPPARTISDTTTNLTGFFKPTKKYLSLSKVPRATQNRLHSVCTSLQGGGGKEGGGKWGPSIFLEYTLAHIFSFAFVAKAKTMQGSARTMKKGKETEKNKRRKAVKYRAWCSPR